MDVKSLRGYVEVVQQGSFTKAAARLNLTQPTISKMIQQLELSFGVVLLSRVGKRFNVTDAGNIVYERAKEIILTHEKMKAEVRDLKDIRKGKLEISLSPSTHTVLAPVFAAYHAAYPSIELKMHEMGSIAALEALRLGKIELGATMDLSSHETLNAEFDSIPLVESPLCLLVPNTPEWTEKPSVRLADLADSKFIFYGEHFALNDLVLEACNAVGFSPKISGRSSQWDFIATMVSLGVGVALLPKAFCENLDESRFKFFELASPDLRWKLMLAWRRQGQLSFAAEAWLDLAKSILPS